MDVKWVKIRSWHAIAPTWAGWHAIAPTWAVVAGDKHTLCGRYAAGPAVDDLPSERSCESCLRIIARLNDQ